MEILFLNDFKTVTHGVWDLVCSWVIFSKISKHRGGSKLAFVSHVFSSNGSLRIEVSN
jgi:hypothetical protein